MTRSFRNLNPSLVNESETEESVVNIFTFTNPLSLIMLTGDELSTVYSGVGRIIYSSRQISSLDLQRKCFIAEVWKLENVSKSKIEFKYLPLDISYYTTSQQIYYNQNTVDAWFYEYKTHRFALAMSFYYSGSFDNHFWSLIVFTLFHYTPHSRALIYQKSKYNFQTKKTDLIN